VDNIRNIPTDVLVFYLVLYGCLPLWTVMGFVDYHATAHRASSVPRSARVHLARRNERAGWHSHFLGLFFEINVLVLQKVIMLSHRKTLGLTRRHEEETLKLLTFVNFLCQLYISFTFLQGSVHKRVL